MPATRTTEHPARSILASALLARTTRVAHPRFLRRRQKRRLEAPQPLKIQRTRRRPRVPPPMPVSALRGKNIVFADPMHRGKKLHYFCSAADYAEIHDKFEPDSGDLPRQESKLIQVFIGGKQRHEYRLDELRHRAISTCFYTNPAPLDTYFASTAAFWDEYGSLCDFADSMDELLATKRALREIHKSFWKLDRKVRLQLARRKMRVLEIKNPFPLLDDRRVAFALEVRERITAYEHLSIEALDASVEFDALSVRLHNRYRNKPFSTKGQKLYCEQELWISDMESFVSAAKIQAREKKTSLQGISATGFYGGYDTVFN
ncbi:hypothetical protein C8R45DRAFT_935894 [Mycena sanguinolenta]|nr:hypothetical protein C8R45DRAFT_935894 [Mycena sanguinolenta]